ncbi:MAG: IS4 family transposase [Hapalosiphonaceae cyanobacterium JJU2]|nr:MAG: IS4 family transposase [Hapalosiphonaceae cyanobacterium JJU2]
MLPQFYQEILEKYLSNTQLITLKMLVWLLQSQKQVKIERLAATLPLPIQHNSRRRHLQRFLKSNKLSVVLLWFPIIEEILSRLFKPQSQLIIALDRTQWKDNNILIVSVIYQKRALPIYWCLLDKEGCSNFPEQQKVLRPVIRLLKHYQLVIIGDREFHGIELSNWLDCQGLKFVFRQKKDTTFREKRQKFQPLSTIPIYPGGRRFYHQVNLTQNKGFGRCNLAVYWKRKYRGKQEPSPWYLSTNLSDVSTAVKIYGQRFGIEAMFKDCKNLEGSQASPERLVRLILLIALSMTSAWLQGQKTQFKRKQSYVCRPCERKRTRRRHSAFWIGLYGQNWIVSLNECQELVLEMMAAVRNKQSFYHQGLMAMMLIQQPL